MQASATAHLATRDDTHLIAVALGCQTSKPKRCRLRNCSTTDLPTMSRGGCLKNGDIVGEMRIAHGTPETVHLVAGEKMTALTAKGEKDAVTSETH